MTHEQFLTTAEVIDYLQVNLRTVYRLLKAGKLPAVRVGRQWRFRKRDLDAWLEQRPRPAAGRGGGTRLTTSDQANRLRVLVAEPAADARELLYSALSGAGYEVEGAIEGPGALERLKTRSYDLLITEVQMPDGASLGVARDARLAHPDLPIIVVTGFSTEAAAIEAIALGVSAYLTKPFEPEALLAAVAKATQG